MGKKQGKKNKNNGKKFKNKHEQKTIQTLEKEIEMEKQIKLEKTLESEEKLKLELAKNLEFENKLRLYLNDEENDDEDDEDDEDDKEDEDDEEDDKEDEDDDDEDDDDEDDDDEDDDDEDDDDEDDDDEDEDDEDDDEDERKTLEPKLNAEQIFPCRKYKDYKKILTTNVDHFSDDNNSDDSSYSSESSELHYDSSGDEIFDTNLDRLYAIYKHCQFLYQNENSFSQRVKTEVKQSKKINGLYAINESAYIEYDNTINNYLDIKVSWFNQLVENFQYFIWLENKEMGGISDIKENIYFFETVKELISQDKIHGSRREDFHYRIFKLKFINNIILKITEIVKYKALRYDINLTEKYENGRHRKAIHFDNVHRLQRTAKKQIIAMRDIMMATNRFHHICSSKRKNNEYCELKTVKRFIFIRKQITH
jgi:hypothetical protein